MFKEYNDQLSLLGGKMISMEVRVVMESSSRSISGSGRLKSNWNFKSKKRTVLIHE